MPIGDISPSKNRDTGDRVTADSRTERFGELYEDSRSRMLAYALRRSASPEDAADVVAETFTIAWRRLDDVPVGDASILWLYATGRRVLANQSRRVRRRAALVDRIGSELGEAVVSHFGEFDVELLSASRALRSLREVDREVLMLVAWEGLDSLQLAEALGCSPTAARIRLHRARARLVAAMPALRPAPKRAPPIPTDTSARPARLRRARGGMTCP